MGPTNEFYVSFTAQTRSAMEQRLIDAHEEAQKQALRHGSKGILITRHSVNHFTVALTESVPFGLTRERYND
ncbi:hypothetical protein J2T11_000103 [Paenarthrobacter nicotinovorans]|uniref:hypothetical protein n=1 Tax=Paenarthrobacter nicotinovorans TaxID=29320 RepID=UPI00278BA839|nr:hypothetical protein [Paenarthrobacter nicotinovorans]MDP9933779.1 hypothetical protein [Paenarthrobacter nicotinovorans]